MTVVKSYAGFNLKDLTSGLKPNFYAHDDHGAYATVDVEGAGEVVLAVYGDFKYGGNEPKSGDVDAFALGVFDAKGHYIPLGTFEHLPKGVDVGDLLDAVRSKSPLDDLVIFNKILGGNDTFAGSKQADFFYGFGGDDDLSGGKGSDTLDGGAGKDTIDCGTGGGDDHVVFSVLDKKSYDIVSNFEGADVLDFAGGAFGKLKEVGGHLDATMFHLGKQAASGDDHLIYDKASGKLFYDADGAGGKDQVLIAKFERGTDIDASHIHVI